LRYSPLHRHFANDIDPFGLEKDHFMSDRSRAQVVAALKQAQIAGELPVAGNVGVKFVDTPSRKTRAQRATKACSF
jgi:hypothetical protein